MTAFAQSAFARPLATLVSCSLGACLIIAPLSLFGCASPDGDGATRDQNAQVDQQAPAYTVELGDIDGTALLGYLKADPSFAADASLVDGIQLAIDRDAHQVDMTVNVATSDVAQMCALGQEVARCLSNRAAVTDGNGAPPADDGPCGALYQAYVLSERVQGIGSDDVVDGLLHPGDNDMMWQ